MTTQSSETFVIPAHWAKPSPLSVLVIGAGGTGSEMLDALARLHYTMIEFGGHGLEIAIADDDVVTVPNVGRQRFLHCDVGLPKSQVLAERYGLLYDLHIVWSDCRIRPSDMNLLGRYDLIITCVDSGAFRESVGRRWRRRRTETLWLDCGNGASTGQVVLGHLGNPAGSGNRLPNVFDLYPDLALGDEDNQPSCSLEAALRSQRLGINRFMADTAVFSVLSPLLLSGVIQSHGAYIDLSAPSVRPLPIRESVWEFLGWNRGRKQYRTGRRKAIRQRDARHKRRA